MDTFKSESAAKENKGNIDAYGPQVVQSLLHGDPQQRVVEDIMKLYSIMKVQGQAVKDLEVALPSKANKSEINSALSLKANIADVSRTVAEVANSIEEKVGYEELSKIMDEKVTKEEVQYLLSNKVSIEEVRRLLEGKATLSEVNQDLHLLQS